MSPDRETNFTDIVNIVNSISSETIALEKEIKLCRHVLTTDIYAYSLPTIPLCEKDAPTPKMATISIIPFLNSECKTILEKVANARIAIAQITRKMNGDDPTTKQEGMCSG